MKQGKIKRWIEEKNFGFIEAGAEWEFFFHISGCAEGFHPREGLEVTFVLGQNDRTGKTQAQDVQAAKQSKEDVE